MAEISRQKWHASFDIAAVSVPPKQGIYSKGEPFWKSWRLHRFEGIMESCQNTALKRGTRLS